jgi:hypothetical protein
MRYNDVVWAKDPRKWDFTNFVSGHHHLKDCYRFGLWMTNSSTIAFAGHGEKLDALFDAAEHILRTVSMCSETQKIIVSIVNYWNNINESLSPYYQVTPLTLARGYHRNNNINPEI